jgi:50S ribosomal subunit-associated GTPase HflX
MAEVKRTLSSLEADDIPQVLVLNKIDAIPPELWGSLKEKHGALLIAAQTGLGLEPLLVELQRVLFREKARAEAIDEADDADEAP